MCLLLKKMISPFYIKNVAKQFYHSEAKSSSLCGVFIEQWFAKYKQFILNMAFFSMAKSILGVLVCLGSKRTLCLAFRGEIPYNFCYFQHGGLFFFLLLLSKMRCANNTLHGL